MRYPYLIVTVLFLLMSAHAGADADGPDYYQLRGVATGDSLNIRDQPYPNAIQLGEIPADADCIRNLGCRGGLTYLEYTTLSAAQQAQRLRENPRWCRVEYRGIIGWVAGRYLAEGSCGMFPEKLPD